MGRARLCSHGIGCPETDKKCIVAKRKGGHESHVSALLFFFVY
jgi:hypothetical protein